MIKRSNLLLLIIIVFLSGCAQTKHYVPQPIKAQYSLTGIPADIVSVNVNDLRAERINSIQLTQIIKAQIINALSTKKQNVNLPHYDLHIDIIEHRSFFTLGNWNASTKLRVKLMNSKNNIIGSWNAVGNAHRSNLAGYATAKAVSQDAYNIAIADMMSSLSTIELKN